MEAFRRKSSPVFMNRLDATLVFHPLKPEELRDVLDMELEQVPKRVLDASAVPLLIQLTREGRDFLLAEGTDQRYGARHLKRAIERYVVSPLASLLATGQVRSGDALVIDRHPGKKGLAFIRDKKRRSACENIPFAASVSNQLVTAQVGA